MASDRPLGSNSPNLAFRLRSMPVASQECLTVRFSHESFTACELSDRPLLARDGQSLRTKAPVALY